MRPLRGGATLLPYVGRSGLVIMLVGLLETENIRSFGRMCGLVVCSFESDLVDYLICQSMRESWCLIGVS